MTLISEAKGAAPRAQPPKAGEQQGGAVQQAEGDMNPLALVFLDNPLARRLAVAWQTCAGDEDLWLDMAGISRNEMDDARRICFALRQNNICQDGGQVSRVALSYIQAIVVAPLTKQTKGGKGRGRR